MTRALVLVASLAALGLAAGCGRKSDRATGSDYSTRPADGELPGTESAPASSDVTIRVHSDFQDSVQRRFDEIDRKLDELRVKVDAAAADQRDDLRRLEDDFVVQREKLKAELRDLRATASEKWDEARDRLDSSLSEFERKVSDALR